MKNKKYEFVDGDTITTPNGKKLKRIRALVAIGLSVAAGDLGGYIESEKNLSTSGNAWVSGDAWVYGDAWVSRNARVESQTDWLLVGPAKSSGRFTTAYRDTKIGVRVSCGCFTGTAQEFSAQIEETHAGNQQHLQQYRLFCQLIAFSFDIRPA